MGRNRSIRLGVLIVALVWAALLIAVAGANGSDYGELMKNTVAV